MERPREPHERPLLRRARPAHAARVPSAARPVLGCAREHRPDLARRRPARLLRRFSRGRRAGRAGRRRRALARTLATTPIPREPVARDEPALRAGAAVRPDPRRRLQAGLRRGDAPPRRRDRRDRRPRRRADVRQHDRRDGAERAVRSRASTACSSQSPKRNTNRTLQKIEERRRAEARRARRRHPPRPEALRARQGASTTTATRSSSTEVDEYLVERYHLDFVRAGAELSEADKTPLRALNKEESSLSADFTKKLLAATKAGALVVDHEAELAGLQRRATSAPPAEAAKAREARRQVGARRSRTRRSSRRRRRSRNRATRERLFRASTQRAEHGGDERHARDRRCASPQLRCAEGEAPRLPDVRRLRPRRPDGGDAGRRRSSS